MPKKTKIEKLHLTSNPKALAKVIKKDIASIKRGRKFIGYYEAFEFSKKIDCIIDDIESYLFDEDKTQASTLLKELILTDSKVYLRSDDSAGVIQSAYHRAEDLWKKCVIEQSSEQIYKDLYELLFCDGFGLRYVICESFPQEVLTRLYDEFYKSFDPKSDSFDTLHLLKDTAHALKSPKLYIKAIELYNKEFSNNDYLDIAKEYKFTDDAKSTLLWLEKREGESYRMDEHFESIIWAYDSLKESQKAREELKKWYDRSLQVSVLKRYFKRLDAKELEMEKENIVKSTQELHPEKSMELLMSLDEKELCQEYILSHKSEINKSFMGDSFIKKIIKWIEPTSKESVLFLYRNMIDASLDSANSKYYPSAIKHIQSMLKIEPNNYQNIISNKEYISKLLEKHSKKYRFMELFESKVMRN
jgi:hypothetical protein